MNDLSCIHSTEIELKGFNLICEDLSAVCVQRIHNYLWIKICSINCVINFLPHFYKFKWMSERVILMIRRNGITTNFNLLLFSIIEWRDIMRNYCCEIFPFFFWGELQIFFLNTWKSFIEIHWVIELQMLEMIKKKSFSWLKSYASINTKTRKIFFRSKQKARFRTAVGCA